MSVTIYVNAISLIAPGLPNWQQSQAVLREEEQYQTDELVKFSPAVLPANERRRTTPLIKLALHAAEQCIGSDLEAAQHYATVFASSDGDHGILDKICTALTLPDRPVSPTNFHNSVHNAAAGYWAIAAKAQHNSNSLSGCDETFSVALIEAATYVAIEQKSVLFVTYDYPAPSPLDGVRHLEGAFAVALCLSSTKQTNSLAALEIQPTQDITYSTCTNPALEKLRLGNPAARSLPLLQTLATQKTTAVILPHVQSSALKINAVHY